MLKRTISGIIGASLVVLAILFNQSFPIFFNILIAAVTSLCMYEIFVAMGILDKYIIKIPTFAFNIIVPLFIYIIFIHIYDSL